MEDRPGLADLLREELDPHAIIRPTRIENLWMAPSGQTPPNPSELIGSDKMRQLMRDLREEFDLVLCDAPSILVVTDPVLLAKCVDTVVLVLSPRYARRETVTRAKKFLETANANIAGAVPFAIKGTEKEFQGYNLIVIVKKDSPYQKLADLKGKKLAHTSPSSNSGHLAPLALFPKEGRAPETDYKVLFSGKHDQSVPGVNTGDYDAAAVASDVFERMARRGQVKEADFRVIYRSQKFPTSSFAYAHDLEPALRDRMLGCFYDYRFPDEMKKAFDGADRFFPVTYLKDWAVVRKVAEGGGDAADLPLAPLAQDEMEQAGVLQFHFRRAQLPSVEFQSEPQEAQFRLRDLALHAPQILLIHLPRAADQPPRHPAVLREHQQTV